MLEERRREDERARLVREKKEREEREKKERAKNYIKSCLKEAGQKIFLQEKIKKDIEKVSFFVKNLVKQENLLPSQNHENKFHHIKKDGVSSNKKVVRVPAIGGFDPQKKSETTEQLTKTKYY